MASANAPVSDKRSTPVVLNGVGGTHNGNTTFATLAADGSYLSDWEGDKPGSGTHSVWYRWTSPQDGKVVMSADSLGFDPVISAHPANDGSIWRADGNANADGDATVSFYVRQGQTWDIKVDAARPRTSARSRSRSPSTARLTPRSTTTSSSPTRSAA